MLKAKGVRQGNLLELLPHLDIADGIVINDNGVIEVGVELRLPSALMTSPENTEGAWRRVKTALRQIIDYKERARIYVEAHLNRGRAIQAFRENIRTSHRLLREMAMSQADHLDRQRARRALLEWKAYVTVSRRVRKKGRVQFTPEEWTELLQSGRSLQERLRANLEAAGLSARVMTTQEVFDALWRYMNIPANGAPAPAYKPFHTQPSVPGEVAAKIEGWHQMTARAQAVGAVIDTTSPDYLKVGDLLVDAVAVFSAPDETFIGMLSRVLDGVSGGQVYVVTELEHEPLEPVIVKLQADARKYQALADGEGMRDITAKSKLVEAEKAMDYLTSTGDHVYKTSFSVIFASEDAEQQRMMRERVLAALSYFPGSRPTYGAGVPYTLYFSLVPFNGERSPFSWLATETNAADLFPLALPWEGHSDRPTLLYQNRFRSLTAIDAFNRKAANWNGLVVAGSGSGKTFFAQSLLASLLAQGDAEVMIVDRGRGYVPLIEALFGPEAIIPIAPGEASINPFDLEPGQIEPSDAKKSFVVAVIKAMLRNEVDPIEDAVLAAAIEQTYRRAVDERRTSEGGYRAFYRGARLSDLVRTLHHLNEIGERMATPEDRAAASRLATRLQKWTGDTPLGRFVDRETSFDTDLPIIYFETTGLEGSELEAPALLMLADILWRRIERSNKRKLVVMDEVWALLQVPAARQLIVDLYRRARRFNTAIYSISQSVTDFTRVDGLLTNVSYFYIGILPDAERQVLHNALKVPQSVTEAISELQMIRGQYSEWVAYTIEAGRPQGEVLRVEASPLSYWLFTTDPVDMARRKELAERYGSMLEAVRELSQRRSA